MKRVLSALFFVASAAALAPACNGGFPSIGQGKKLVVSITKGDVGSTTNPLAISTSVESPASFTVNIQAQKPDGTVDTGFNGYVALSSQPGTIVDLTVRNVQLHNGVADGVVLPIIGAFGATHIQAEDVGYEPAAPNSKPPPECSDGIDNNGNGLIDYPADPGCYAPVDNTEDLGSYAAGVSGAIQFAEPRIPLVRGYDPANNGNGNATAFPHQQISIDTGWRGGENYAFDTIVIGLTASGFYVEDKQNDVPESKRTGYNGLYAYNFSTPSFMRVCDRVRLLSGTSSDFYGYTELNYPTWELEYWDIANGPCLVPDATVLGPDDVANPNYLWQVEATLTRVGTTLGGPNINVHIGKHFGSGFVPKVNGTYTPDNTHSNCDFNHNGKVDYTDADESACAAVCVGSCSTPATDSECSEWSQFQSQNNFELVVTDPTTNPVKLARIQGNAAAANLFNPVDQRDSKGNPIPIHSFTGLLSYFSGGCQFTMQARCQDDITVDMNTAPKSTQEACVHPRTLSDINANSQ